METFLLIAVVLLWIVVLVEGVLLLGVIRLVHAGSSVTPAQSPSDEVGLKTGQIAPSFVAVDRLGNRTPSDRWRGVTHALLFVSPTCLSCTATVFEMEALQTKTQNKIVVVCNGSNDDCAKILSSDRLVASTLIDSDSEVSRRFGVATFPTAVVIDQSGRIQSSGHPMRGAEMESVINNQPPITLAER